MALRRGEHTSWTDRSSCRIYDEAVEKLFRAHHDNLIRFLRTQLGNEGEAHEAAQEAYLRLLAGRDQEYPTFPIAYLYRIARNIAHDYRRKARVRREWEEGHAWPVAEPARQERVAIASEQLLIIRSVVDALPFASREAFRLSRDEGLSSREIGQRLGVGERMVRNYIASALRKIAEAVGDGEQR